MIKLTGTNNTPFWANPEFIESVGHSEYYKGTAIVTNGTEMDETPLIVMESPEEVVRKIINYKTAMIDFASHSAGVVKVLVENNVDIYEALRTEYDRILGYAGLEEKTVKTTDGEMENRKRNKAIAW